MDTFAKSVSVVISASAVLLLLRAAFSAPTTVPERIGEIFRTQLENQSQLVVTRTKLGQSKLIAKLLPEPKASQVTAIYSVRADLLLSDGSRVPIACTLDAEGWATDSGFEVLQAKSDGNSVVLAVTRGSGVGLWRIDLTRMERTALVWLSGWEANQVGMARNGTNVSADLSAVPGGRWRVEVTDKSIGGGATTSFEQDGADWRFVVTYDWMNRGKAAHGELRPPKNMNTTNLNPPSSPVEQVEVFSGNGWWLRIRSDGGGSIGYGGIYHSGAAFPPKTFDYDDLLKHVFPMTLDDVTPNNPEFSVGFPGMSGLGKGHPLGDSAYAKSLFETAHRAIPNNLPHGIIEDPWAKSPPGGEIAK